MATNALRYRKLLRDGHASAFPDAIRLLERLRLRGYAIAVVSASTNADITLSRLGLTNQIDLVVHGRHLTQYGLAGKPHPDAIQHACRRLGIPVDRAQAIDDSLTGIVAAVHAKVPKVIGVARDGTGKEMKEHGATHVVGDLDEIIV